MTAEQPEPAKVRKELNLPADGGAYSCNSWKYIL